MSNAKFQEGSTTATVEASINCPNCGIVNKEAGAFCNHCGQKLQEAGTTPHLDIFPTTVGQSRHPVTDGSATVSLVLGILSVTILSILAGIPAILLGQISRREIRRSMGRLDGRGMALAGLIMGYVSVAT